MEYLPFINTGLLTLLVVVALGGFALLWRLNRKVNTLEDRLRKVAPWIFASVVHLNAVYAFQEAMAPKIWTDNDYWEAAAADATKLPRELALFSRYVACPERNDTSEASACANLLSRGPVLYQATPPDPRNPYPPIAYLYGGKLARVHLRAFAPDETNNDLKEFVEAWEELRHEPKYNFLLTEDTIKFATLHGIDLGEFPKGSKTKTILVRETVPEYKATDGNTYNWRMVKKEVPDIELLRIVGHHLNPEAVSALIDATRSQAPLVSKDYFVARSLRQIQGDGIFKTIYGGLYYKFKGIKKAAKGEGTDLDLFLEQFAGLQRGKKNFKQLFDSLRSDQRVGMFKSRVTGKVRAVILINTSAGLRVRGMSSITLDVKDKSIDIGKSALHNLIDIVDLVDAMEVFVVGPNGNLVFALFNGKGELQDTVPEDVAVDDTIPAGHTKTLQPAISCISCHGPHDGWQPLRNDVPKFVNFMAQDIFNDVGDKGRTPADRVSRIQGLYQGDPEEDTLPGLRNDQAKVLYRGAGVWYKPDGKPKDLVDSARDTFGALAATDRRYWYETINAERAAKYGAFKEPLSYKTIKPPRPVAGALFPESPNIGGLLSGCEINRTNFDLEYTFIQARRR